MKRREKENNFLWQYAIKRKSNYTHEKPKKWEINNQTTRLQTNIAINGFKIKSLVHTCSQQRTPKHNREEWWLVQKWERTWNTKETYMRSISKLTSLSPENLKNSHICLTMVGKEIEIRCKEKNRKITSSDIM